MDGWMDGYIWMNGLVDGDRASGRDRRRAIERGRMDIVTEVNENIEWVCIHLGAYYVCVI